MHTTLHVNKDNMNTYLKLTIIHKTLHKCEESKTITTTILIACQNSPRCLYICYLQNMFG